MGHPETETLGRYAVVRRSGRRDTVPGGVQRPLADAPLARVRSYLVRTRDGEDRQLRQLHLLDPSPHPIEVVRRGVERYRAQRHPALSPVLDCFELDGGLALVFAREEGVALDRLKGYLDRDRERLPDAAVWFLGWQLAGALAVGHLARDDGGGLAPLVHGALTMQDVLISWDGGVRVEGLCPFLGSPPGGPGSRDTAPSRAWLAPEVRRGELPSPRSDVYAVALILRALLSGAASPAAGPSAERIASLRPDIPADVAEALDRALDEPTPRARPSAAELSQRLEGLVRVTEGRRALNDCMELYQALWGLWSVAAPDHWSHDDPGQGDESDDDRHTFPGPEPKMLPRPTAAAEPRDEGGAVVLAETSTDDLGAEVEAAPEEQDDGPRTSRSPGTDAPPSSAPTNEAVVVADALAEERAEPGTSAPAAVSSATQDDEAQDDEARDDAPRRAVVGERPRPASEPRAEASNESLGRGGRDRPREPRGSAEPGGPAAERSSHGWLIAAVAVVGALLVWYVLGEDASTPGDGAGGSATTLGQSAVATGTVSAAAPSTGASVAPAVTRSPPSAAASTAATASSSSAASAAAAASSAASASTEPDEVDPPLSFDEGLLRIESKAQVLVFVNGVAVGPTNKTNRVRCGQRFVRLGVELGKWVNGGRSIPLACGEVTRQTMEAEPP